MTVVVEILRQGLTHVAVAAIRDPEAVATMIQASAGARVTVRLGGKTDIPALGLKGEPLEVTDTVMVILKESLSSRGRCVSGWPWS